MHLSLISDWYGDADKVLHAGDRQAAGRAHLDAVVRAALFAVALVLPFGLAAATAAFDHAKAPSRATLEPHAAAIPHLRIRATD